MVASALAGFEGFAFDLAFDLTVFLAFGFGEFLGLVLPDLSLPRPEVFLTALMFLQAGEQCWRKQLHSPGPGSHDQVVQCDICARTGCAKFEHFLLLLRPVRFFTTIRYTRNPIQSWFSLAARATAISPCRVSNFVYRVFMVAMCTEI